MENTILALGKMSDVEKIKQCINDDKNTKIIVIIPDLANEKILYEKNNNNYNCDCIHLYKEFDNTQKKLLNSLLVDKKILRPILWLFDEKFAEYFYNKVSLHKIWNSDNLPHNSKIGNIFIIKNNETNNEDIALYLENKNPTHKNKKGSTLRVLMIINKDSMNINTVREYVEAFALESKYDFYYTHRIIDKLESCNLIKDKDNKKLEEEYKKEYYEKYLDYFDVVLLHYSVRMTVENYLSPYFVEAIRAYNGHKLLIVQDEYEYVESTRKMIEKLGIHDVFTILQDENIEKVYPQNRFPDTRFHSVLTGYVTNDMKNRKEHKPLSERKKVFCYRGRELAYWYGELGRDKIEIGKKMKEVCEKKGINCDIEYEEMLRIYGEEWNDFISSSRAMLASESGANIFDFDDSLRNNISKKLKKNPNWTYEEAKDEFLKDREGEVECNASSPKMFEAIALKTALVMYEGYYSGIFEPHRHYIPLKKDFSNIDEVINKVLDDEYIKDLTERAYNEIILSGKYDYKNLIQNIDSCIEQSGAYRSYDILYNLMKDEIFLPTNISNNNVSFYGGIYTSKPNFINKVIYYLNLKISRTKLLKNVLKRLRLKINKTKLLKKILSKIKNKLQLNI